MGYEVIGTVTDVNIKTRNGLNFCITLSYNSGLSVQNREKYVENNPTQELNFKSINNLSNEIKGINWNRLYDVFEINSPDVLKDSEIRKQLENQILMLCKNKVLVVAASNDFNEINIVADIKSPTSFNNQELTLVLTPDELRNVNNFNELQNIILNQDGKIRFDDLLKFNFNKEIHSFVWVDENGANLFDANNIFIDNDNGSVNINGVNFEQQKKISKEWINQIDKIETGFYIPTQILTNYEEKKPLEIQPDSRNDEILNHFDDVLTNKYSLVLNQNDIINFHISLKSSLFTILAGISGTGKSKIVTAYADSLGIKNPRHFNMISVSPDWRSSSDLLGYVDAMNNIYRPSESGLVDTLIDASEHPDKMYIVVLDEMNLARVEYYFSQFLSVMEKDPNDREIVLYDDGIQNQIKNSNEYPARIKINQNIRFVGTMNIDETTFQISDKVLDRTNVIRLNKEPFLKVNDRIPRKNYVEDRVVGAREYASMIALNENKFDEIHLRFLDELYKLINDRIPTFGFGWRTVTSINQFMLNVNKYDYGDFNDRTAFDAQIAQRILPKLRGTRRVLLPLFNSDQSIDSLLDANSELSDFQETRKLLDQKENELKVNGYVS